MYTFENIIQRKILMFAQSNIFDNHIQRNRSMYFQFFSNLLSNVCSSVLKASQLGKKFSNHLSHNFFCSAHGYLMPHVGKSPNGQLRHLPTETFLND